MSKYDSWSKERLITEIKQLKKTTYGLLWDDKPEDVAELCKTKLPVLVDVEDKEVPGDSHGPANILIEGDNYHALSVLNYTHKGKIDFIYIDPPYNTGAKDWKYNNAFVDAQDPYRHSKWLSFMEKRLRFAKNLLTDRGIICVTIDDYEVPRLWMLMDKIFGESNHLGTVVMHSDGAATMGIFYIYQLLESMECASHSCVIDPGKFRSRLYILCCSNIAAHSQQVGGNLASIASRALDTYGASKMIGETYRIYTFAKEKTGIIIWRIFRMISCPFRKKCSISRR